MRQRARAAAAAVSAAGAALCLLVLLLSGARPRSSPSPPAARVVRVEPGPAKQLQIYTYDLPARFNVDISCNDSMFSVEQRVHEYLGSARSAAYTSDPSEADFFYVPVYSTCFRAAQEARGETRNLQRQVESFVAAALAHIRSKYAFWDRNAGADHVWLFPHDLAACFDFAASSSQQARIVRGALQHRLRNSLRLTFLGNLTSPCFDPWRSIVIPPFVKNSRELLLQDDRQSMQPRKYLVSFVGKLEWARRYRDYSYGVRRRIHTLFSRDPRAFIHDGHHPDYLTVMHHSTFCLSPPGFSNFSPRLAEALLGGRCIPVVIGERQRHSFDNVVDYDRISVTVPFAAVDSIMEILAEISQERIAAMRAEIARVRAWFAYDARIQGNAFAHIVQQLALRKQLKPL